MVRALCTLAVSAIACALYLTGWLDPLSWRLADLQFRLLTRPAVDGVTVVAIDPVSLRNVGVWPWPRSLHGRVIDQLADAGAAAIVVDVDFAAASDPDEDQALAAALARSPMLVTLPVFRQYDDLAISVPGRVVDSVPLPLFQPFVQLASANVAPEPDGLIRRLSAAEDWEGQPVPTLAAVLSGRPDRCPDRFIIDFGIVPDGIPRLSYFDVLVGNFDPRLVEGRRIVIAATAVELGDVAPVPAYQALPGGYVQALAAQSLMQGRQLVQTPTWAVILGIVAIAAAGTWLFPAMTWRWGLCALAAVAGFLIVAAGTTYAAVPHLLDVVPWILTAALAYAAALALRVDDQALRLVAQTIDLRRRHAFMSRVAEHAFDGLVTADRTGRILSFSGSAQRIFGYTARQAVGMRLDEICLPSCTGPTALLGGPAETTGTAAPVCGNGRLSFETVGRHADGALIPIDVAVTEMVEDGEATVILAIRDISERKAAEANEARARERLADAVESSPCGFALFDRDDRLVLCNARYRDFFDAVAHRLRPGTHVFEIVSAYAAAVDLGPRWVGQCLRHWSEDGAAYESELPDGRHVSIDRHATADGGHVVIVTDTTVARQREYDLLNAKMAAEHASAAKSEFLAMVSHELRTPLNAVIGFSDMMTMEVFGELGDRRYGEYVQAIKASGEHLLGLINAILDFTKIDAGYMEIKEDTVDLKDVVDQCVYIASPLIDEHRLSVDVDLDASLPAIRGDKALISRAVMNALSNAVKFTLEQGGIRVRASCDAAGNVVLSVSDTGIGIAAEDIDTALEPFRQIDSALSRKYEGTGLGLPLAKAAVELHGGALTLTSEVGVGTTVAILLPKERVLPPTTVVGPDTDETGPMPVRAAPSS